ncbi:MAG: NADPH:quinone reductase [Micrococcales bacterium]|nr:NADPH:quinone reductase [Micrococcales bacterium]
MPRYDWSTAGSDAGLGWPSLRAFRSNFWHCGPVRSARAVQCDFVSDQIPTTVLSDVVVEVPEPRSRDILVQVEAVSVNPIDTKVRRRMTVADSPRVLGWDAAGVVRALGSDVQSFEIGDRVWYAGALTRPGSNCELQLVDERIVARRPASLNPAEAAALPLTSLTAWELLFDRLEVNPSARILVVGAAGGVGSIAVQLADYVGAAVIGTASRAETNQWLNSLGITTVLNHSRSLEEELSALNVSGVSHVALLTQSAMHFAAVAAILAPQGKLGMIDDPAEPIDITLLKGKSISLHWESMFTRSLYETSDMTRQHDILNQIADLVDEGSITSTFNHDLGVICAENLEQAHELVASQRTIGKIVLSGWPEKTN